MSKNVLGSFGLIGAILLVIISVIAVIYNLIVNGFTPIIAIFSDGTYWLFLLPTLFLSFLFAFTVDSVNKDKKSDMLNLLYLILEIGFTIVIFIKFSWLNGWVTIILATITLGVVGRLKEEYILKKITQNRSPNE